MNYLVFARVVVIATLYLELVDDEALDPDTAVQGMEDIGTVLQDLTPEQVAELDRALQQVALEYEGEQREQVRTMARDYGLVEYPDDEEGK